MTRTFFFFVLWSAFSTNVFSSHIAGGELYLHHRNDSLYDLYYIQYFDELNGSPVALDEQITVSLFATVNNQFIKDYTLDRVHSMLLPLYSVDCADSNVSTSMQIYKASVILDASLSSVQGYYFAYDRCCKTDQIDNLFDSGNMGTIVYLNVPSPVHYPDNTSPEFLAIYNAYAVKDSLFEYDLSARDVDGDSLAYELITLKEGYSDMNTPVLTPAYPKPYADASWAAGYSYSNYIPSLNPTFSIDSVTGIMSLRPIQSGFYVFMYLCKEYRNGVQIGEVTREFQLYVKDTGDCKVRADNDRYITEISPLSLAKKWNKLTYYYDRRTQEFSVPGTESFAYRLYDVTGRCMQEGQSHGERLKINILPGGIYLLRLQVNGVSHTLKIVL